MFTVLALASTVALLASSGKGAAPDGMAAIPAGTFAPLYGEPVRVAAFALDRVPVTRGEFLAFVRDHRAWRRGVVGRDRAGETYLSDWTDALSVGSGDAPRRPAVNVSWYAANAYCAARGKRLPSTAEWERAAAASSTRADASRDPAFAREVLSLYATRAARASAVVGQSPKNVFGVSDLHALVWEWTSDFDGPRTSATHEHHHHSGDRAAAEGHQGSCASAAIGARNTDDYAAFLRSAVRASLEKTSATQHLGFRCAADLT